MIKETIAIVLTMYLALRIRNRLMKKDRKEAVTRMRMRPYVYMVLSLFLITTPVLGEIVTDYRQFETWYTNNNTNDLMVLLNLKHNPNGSVARCTDFYVNDEYISTVEITKYYPLGVFYTQHFQIVPPNITYMVHRCDPKTIMIRWEEINLTSASTVYTPPYRMVSLMAVVSFLVVGTYFITKRL